MACGRCCKRTCTAWTFWYAAINSYSMELLGEHLRTCVAENLRQGNDEVIDELVNVLQKLMK